MRNACCSGVAFGLVIGLVALGSSTVLAAPEDAERAAAAAGAAAPYMGSAEAIQSNLTGPLFSEQPMMNFEGEEFDVQLGCLATEHYLEMFIAPDGLGDITTFQISQDTTKDGTVDRLYTPPHVSVVCANGFQSCSPGTTEECESYAWVASDDNALSVLPTNRRQLGGCYCVNESCGAGIVVRNLTGILTDLGGGAASALAAKDPYYTISSTTVDGPMIRFSGNRAIECDGMPPLPMDLTEFQSAPLTLRDSGVAFASSNDVYELITESPVATEDTSEYVTCNTDRHVALDESTIDDIIDYDSGSGGISPCGTDCLRLTLGRVGDNYWSGKCAYREESVRFNVLMPDRIISAHLKRAVWDDWMQVWLGDHLVWSGPKSWPDLGPVPGKCELNTSWKRDLDVDFTSALAVAGPAEFKIRVEVSGLGEGYAYAEVRVDTTCQLGGDDIVDGCRAYEEDPACVLEHEEIDGVVTFDGYASTGLVPLPVTETIEGRICTFDVTRDWFHKERRYRCEGRDRWDFSEAFDRQAYIKENAERDTYQDRVLNPETGIFEYHTGSFSLVEDIEVAPCTPVCKTRMAREANDVGRGAPRHEYLNENLVYDTYYHECRDDVCPMEGGEELLKACACINEFTEASAIMQAIRQAGRDVICTSGVPRPPSE